MKKVKIFGLIATGILISTSTMSIIADTEDIDIPINDTTLTNIPKGDSESNHMIRKLGGVTGRWFVINGKNEFFSPTINIQKDSTDTIEFSKIISQNSGSSYNFSETVLFSDGVSIQTLPEVIVPSGTTYSIEYTIDKTTFTSVPPSDITSLKGIKVIFSKMNASERVEIKNTAIINWNNTHSGANELAQYFEDDIIQSAIYFDSYRMVTAVYKDELGTDLSEPEFFYGVLGDKYSTYARTIPGYKLTVMPNNASGQFSDDDQTVSYIYKKEAVAGGDVTVKYLDSHGKNIANDIVKSGNIGEDYTTEQKNIEGYSFKEVQGDISGQFQNQPQTVIYVYTKNPVISANVTVNYVDEDGNQISEDVIKSGNIGDIYNTEQKDINGYTFKEVKGNTTGQLTDQAQTVTYVYRKNKIPNIIGTILVKYIDIEGNSISGDIVKSGTVGEDYNTEKKDIWGYTFKEVKGNKTGQFTEQVQIVTYVYAKNKTNPVGPESKPGNKPNSKDKNSNQSKTSSSQNALPATGENERMTMVNGVLGLMLLAFGAAVLIFRFKKVNK
ncbi:MucBP domain-containing protein [Lactococcus petauri]|uniref:MucBP domain-containing protein n=1 Tax=Lactococcus petauri TaxID=1940789 RepID=UPI002079060C|nr:MucBP domain-containing protein [Lactococcus petauri]USI67563.1 MucBP domain-containing protein [Lactococcus petauri]WJE12224.1 MucBP domain-containing protein [Lactococcus petauri]